MVMQSLRQGASGGIFKFILFGILIFAVGGLVLMDVGGFFRGGVASSDVARVGDKTISITSFDRKLRGTLNRMGMTPGQAFQMGYIDQLLASEIRSSLVEQAAADAGLIVGHDEIAKEVRTLIDPMVQQGQSPADVLNQILLSQGMSEGEFANAVGRDMASGVFSRAIENGFSVINQDMAHDFYSYLNEKRTVEYIAFKEADMKDFEGPNEENLQSLYELTKESYAQPETRVFKILKIKDESLRKTIEISEEELKQLYEDGIDLYSMPELRTLEQANFASESEAQKVADKARKDGKGLEKAVKDVTGSGAAYLGQKVLSNADIQEEIRDDVVAAESDGDVVGPIETSLGWQVVLVTDIKPPVVRGFNEVKDELRKEQEEARLTDERYNLAATVDDLFAGGSSLEEVGKQVELDMQTLPAMNSTGQNTKGENILKKYESVSGAILESGFDLNEGETSPVMEMQDGSFVAIHAATVTPKTYKSFEEVKEQLITRWTEDQRRLNNKLLTAAKLAAIEDAAVSLSEAAKKYNKTVEKINGLTRQDTPVKPLTQNAVAALFDAELQKPLIIEIDGGAAIAVVTSIDLPQISEKEKNKAYEEFLSGLKRDAQNDALMTYLQTKSITYGAAVNQKLLNQVYGQEQNTN